MDHYHRLYKYLVALCFLLLAFCIYVEPPCHVSKSRAGDQHQMLGIPGLLFTRGPSGRHTHCDQYILKLHIIPAPMPFYQKPASDRWIPLNSFSPSSEASLDQAYLQWNPHFQAAQAVSWLMTSPSLMPAWMPHQDYLGNLNHQL